MNNAIFLSASVPDAKRAPEFSAIADSVAIASAVSALLYVTLGRRPIVWGGHPAITPMVREVCKQFDLDYGSWVLLYQTDFYREFFPAENEEFDNVVVTEKKDSKEESLELMRRKMLSDCSFESAVFIGGMEGIIEEAQLFAELQPDGKIFPVHSTGGACLQVRSNVDGFDDELKENLDYISIFHRYLNIPFKEARFASLEKQPENMDERDWNSV